MKIHLLLPLIVAVTTASLSRAEGPSAPGIINPVTGLPAGSSTPAGGINPASGLPGRLNPATGLPTTEADNSLSEVRQLISDGQYQEALRRCLEFHDQHKVGSALIPLLPSWIELGRRFPMAKAALVEIRDKDVREFSEGRGYFDLFMEIKFINSSIHQEDATYELYKSFRDADQELAHQGYSLVENLLIEKGEYQWCYDHMGDPQSRFASFRQSFDFGREQQLRLAEVRERVARQTAEMNQRHNITTVSHPMPDMSAMMAKLTDDRFVNQMLPLIEILVATGHKAEAEKIRDQSIEVLNDERLKSAVSRAEVKIRR